MSAKRSRLTVAASLLALSVSAAAENLSEVLKAASDADPQWRATLATFEARGEVITQGRAGILPSLVLSAEMFSNDLENNLPAPAVSGTGDSQQLALTFTQPLLRFDRWYQYQSARANASLTDAEFVAAEQEFLLRVTETYLNVLRATEQRSYARAEEAALSRQLEQARQRFKVGLIAITDVHETQAAHDLARVGLIVAESELAINRARLETMTGKRYSKLAFPGEDIPVALPVPEGGDAWAEKAREGNARLIAARHAARAAKQNARAAGAGHLPNIDFVAQHAQQESDVGGTTTQDNSTTAVGLRLNWPLFAGGAVNSQRKQANAEADAAQASLRAAELNAVEGARTLYRVVEADVLRVSARKQAIVSAQSALDATQAGYEVGTRNIVDVLQAQRGAFAARRDLANARYDYILDVLRLHEAAGSLARGNLDEGNKWLNVTLMLDDGAPAVDPNAAVSAPAKATPAPAPAEAAGKP
jgi:outer membrane protein